MGTTCMPFAPPLPPPLPILHCTMALSTRFHPLPSKPLALPFDSFDRQTLTHSHSHSQSLSLAHTRTHTHTNTRRRREREKQTRQTGTLSHFHRFYKLLMSTNVLILSCWPAINGSCGFIFSPPPLPCLSFFHKQLGPW